MRTYYLFDIKEPLMYFYKNKGYSLYKILEDIYKIENNNVNLGYRMFLQLANKIKKDEIDNNIYNIYKNEFSYSNSSGHIINNLYSRECTVMKIYNTHIKIKSNVNYCNFFSCIFSFKSNMFVCDFENKDYFWIEKIMCTIV